MGYSAGLHIVRYCACVCRAKHIPLGSLENGVFDDPLGEGSGAAVIFGNTGGVMEAALRTAYELATGGRAGACAAWWC